MKKERLQLLLALPLLAGLLMPVLLASPAKAAEEKPLAIKTMRISVWPEYDDPRVLVILQGEFTDASAFPKQVKFPAPLGAEVNQVCALRQPDNEHLCQLYEAAPETDSLGISYTLPISNFLIEYYYNGVKGSPDKTVAYKYVSPYPVGTVDIEVAQPLRSTDFKLGQAYSNITSDGDGVKYYHYTVNSVAAGQEISIGLSYTKADSKPSVAKKQASASPTSGGSKVPYTVIGIAGAAVVGIVAFAVVKRRPAHAMGRTGRSRGFDRNEIARPSARVQRETTVPQRKRTPLPSATPAVSNRVSSFCPSCGLKLDPGDNFCPGCGTRSRSPSQQDKGR